MTGPVADRDPTRRFSSRVEDYVRFRPGYPEGVFNLLAREGRLGPAATVADIGSGTGILCEPMLLRGARVGQGRRAAPPHEEGAEAF